MLFPVEFLHAGAVYIAPCHGQALASRANVSNPFGCRPRIAGSVGWCLASSVPRFPGSQDWVYPPTLYKLGSTAGSDAPEGRRESPPACRVQRASTRNL